jgi:hypothetical protein
VGLRFGGAALIALLASAPPALAQRTNFQGIAECSRAGAIQFKRRDHAFRRFVIDRASVVTDRYSAMAGNQFISTIYSGTATYDSGAGSRKVQFTCLHAGAAKGVVFVYTLPR